MVSCIHCRYSARKPFVAYTVIWFVISFRSASFHLISLYVCVDIFSRLPYFSCRSLPAISEASASVYPNSFWSLTTCLISSFSSSESQASLGICYLNSFPFVSSSTIISFNCSTVIIRRPIRFISPGFTFSINFVSFRNDITSVL